MTNENETLRQVREQLLDVGWKADDILQEPSISQGGRVVRPDLIALCNLFPLAVIETKSPVVQLDNIAEGARQRAEAAGVPFAFATDGNTILEVRFAGSEYRRYEKFPSPSDLWLLLDRKWDEHDPRLFAPFRQPKFIPRFHQAQAVSQALEAVMNGNKRILLSMATGSGKSYVALQIAWKLIKSGYCRRMLYLTYYRVALEEARHVFGPFGNSMVSLTGWEIADDEVHQVQFGTTNYFLHGGKSTVLQKYSHDFYDLIILPEVDVFGQVEPVNSHFPDAVKIGFSHRAIPDSRVTQYFRNIVFRYSLEEALAAEEIKVPEGFRAVLLGHVAQFQRGISAKRQEAVAEQPQENVISFVTTRDVWPDGAIDLNQLSQVDLDVTQLGNQRKVDEKLLLQPNDILIASVTTGIRIRVGIVPPSLNKPVTFSSTLIRIRVDPHSAEPRDVLAFLLSGSGQQQLRRIAASVGTSISRISARDLEQVKVFLPEAKVPKSAKEELGVISQAKIQLRTEILPLLDKLEQVHEGDIDSEDQPRILATKLHQIAAQLAPPELPECVMGNYPTPIALAYRRFHDARFNVYEQVLRLRDLFEASSYFVYNLVLADLFRRLDPRCYYIDDRGARRAYNGYSMSARMDLVAKVLEISRSNSGQKLFIPELAGASVVDLAKQLQEDFRNQLSHTATATESRQRNVLEKFEPLVHEMLAGLEFLAEYRLVRIPSFYFKQGSLVRRMEIYRGVVPDLDEQTICSLA
jgi:type I restriction enzyme R subunit